MADMALAGLQWVASPIINKLLADASSYLGVDMARELQDLETTVLPQFDMVIEAAEKSPHRDKLKAWLQRLKEAYYDTEDLLDDHEYNILKRKAKSGKDPLLEEDGSSITSTIRKPFIAAKSKASNLFGENRRLISKIKELKAILVEAKEFRELLGLPAGNGPKLPVAPTTEDPPATSLPPPKVFGRDSDRNGIIDLLTKKVASGSSTGYSGVAIVAHGGAGKSTLAQYIYNDDRVKEHFDLRMWVCISRKLDVHRHTAEIIESATNESCPRLDNLDTLHLKLRDILAKSDKFLLVLDDVWFEELSREKEWDGLLRPLVSQKTGSRILVTSRRDVLPAALCCKEVVNLGSLDDDEFLALFKHHAFSGSEIGDRRLRLRLEQIAEKIAKRLGQSPLAARTVGSQLSRTKNIAEWEAPLNTDKLSEPMGALLWSYEKLDPRLQRCFLYCSLFPKGHMYDIDELIRFWMAEGLVDSRNRNTRMEDIARDYFNKLVSGSFFHSVSKGSSYVMHDLLHDLAELLSREDCFRLEDDETTEIPCTVRHLSVRVKRMDKHKQSICNLQHLRTVICLDPLIDDMSDLFHKILQYLKKLRVLHLACYNHMKLPESVGELKHLRYLNLNQTLVSELPRSLCTLYHLQLLYLSNVRNSLPDTLCNLTKLRQLEGYYDVQNLSGESLHQIPNIGKLTSLQCLPEFCVQKKKGYELTQLRDMNEIGGTLCVRNLENVTEKDEALESKLYKKKRLTCLDLGWSSGNGMDAEDSLHLEIMNGLKPPPQLSNLTIQGYKSGTYPNWLLEHSYFESLEFFRLVDCPGLEGLPPGALWHCSELHLHNVPNFKTLSCLPAGLTELKIGMCPLLMFVTKNELEQHGIRENMIKADDLTSKLARISETDSTSEIRIGLSEEYSSLRQLATLINDDISEHLQTLLSALEEGDKVLVEENVIKAWLCCHEQRIGLIYRKSIEQPLVPPSGLDRLDLYLCSITDGALAICLGGLTSLQRLKLSHIMTLTALPSEEVFEHLTKLTCLRISSCYGFRSLGGLAASTSIAELELYTCPCLELAHGERFMPVSLECLVIYTCVLGAELFGRHLVNLNTVSMCDCRSSESLLVGHLTSLKQFHLRNFPDLRMFEGLSSLQLQHLTLQGVPKLTAECISPLRVQESLQVSSSVLLSSMLSDEGFTVPPYLSLELCEDPSVSFEGSANFSFLKCLTLRYCEMESLPRNLKLLSSLEGLDIISCPKITSLPDLPSSLQRIYISGCEILKNNCRAPDGESWPKISHIRWKQIY